MKIFMNGNKYLLKHSFKYFQQSLRYCETTKKPFNMIKYLQAKIKFSGPLTVYEYMNEALTNPLGGYYTVKDTYVSKKDFITSPDISQMFGEIIGIWICNEWLKLGAPKPLQLVELGPGNGTMMSDALRVIRKTIKLEDIEIHLVEKSEALSKIQEKTICGSVTDSPEDSFAGDKLHYRVRKTADGIPVHWSIHLHQVPKKFSMIFANEFFDALPIHKLVKTEDGWREMMVDMDDNEPDSFRYVISRKETVMTLAFARKEEKRKFLEVSPEASKILKVLSNRLHEYGGAALFIDYGHDGLEADTFRAYKGHKQVNPLVNPGTRDLTYDVDFSFIRNECKQKLLCIGPVHQHDFLLNTGIQYRLKELLKASTDEETKNNLIDNYNILMDADQMGERFKAICLYPTILSDRLKQFPPIGFHTIVQEK